MLPFDYDTRKRKINLGGSNTAPSSSSILSGVREQRLQRLSQKRQNDAAAYIQAFYRSYLSSKRIKDQLRRRAFEVEEGDVDKDTLTRLRCFMLLGRDEMALERLSSDFVNQRGAGGLFRLAKGPHASSWLICIRKIAWRLLESVSSNPR